MSQLQIGLIVAGIVLVVGVLMFNAWQMRRMRRRLAEQSRPRSPDEARRIEPTFGRADSDEADAEDAIAQQAGFASTPAAEGVEVEHDPDWRPPIDDSPAATEATPARAASHARPPAVDYSAAAPDPDIECVAVLQPVQPAGAAAIAGGLHARLGKPVRWYGRRGGDAAWQRIASDTRGDYAEFAACMLLADRDGAATRAQIEAFVKLAGEIAAALPGAVVTPDAQFEAERAEALDRLCAELDIQIGLTVHKGTPGPIAGTRLRGVAEAAGFRLAPSGRFEWVQEETGAVTFTLQNVTDEPFTAEGLRMSSVSGLVFLLDVPRVTDPPRAFDQMKLAAKRMARTLDGDVVDDNRRPLEDDGFAKIRAQVADAAAALRRHHVEPGSPRALKLFSA
jgi:FtsZ-interacting cell division protein ZipA